MFNNSNHPRIGGVPDKVEVKATPRLSSGIGVDISGAIGQLPQSGATGGQPCGANGGVYPPPGDIINKQ